MKRFLIIPVVLMISLTGCNNTDAVTTDAQNSMEISDNIDTATKEVYNDSNNIEDLNTDNNIDVDYEDDLDTKQAEDSSNVYKEQSIIDDSVSSVVEQNTENNANSTSTVEEQSLTDNSSLL